MINGRNIWRNNYATSLGLVDALKQVTANVAVSTASSLLHVPFSTEGETGIPAEDLKHFAFAVQKLDELKEFAEDNGIDLTGCATKASILQKIREYEADAAAAAAIIAPEG